MDTSDLTPKGKAGFGAACAVCCALPMLVLVGVLSVGALAVGGGLVGSVVLVAATTYGVLSGRIRATPRVARLAGAAVGATAALASLATGSTAAARALAAVGIALVAAAALLALADSRSSNVRV